jgi:hypothetical protein
MPELPPLAEWESFYVIVGSSAAALTGLQFVVIALGAGAQLVGAEASVRAFGTPTVVHFCAVLLLAAILSTPGQTPVSLSLCIGLAGLAGLAYALWVVRHARRQTGYAPVLYDWIWHAGLPLSAYTCLLVAGIAVRWHSAAALYVVGATALLLLYVGIHNAWDAALWMALKRKEP